MPLQEVKVLLVCSRHQQSVDMRDHLGVRSLVHGDRRYVFYYPGEVSDPDVVAVRNKTLRNSLTAHVAPQNTILLLSEPSSVVRFSQSYINQFGLLYSCQEDVRHPHVTFGPAFLSWLVGLRRAPGLPDAISMTRDDLSHAPLPRKSKLISVVTSNLAVTRGHQDRIDFVAALKAHFGDKIDVFGRGFRPFADKWDVLADYKYHIAIENSSSRYYWTEKLSDPFLAGCYPIYYGCTNASDYFPADAFDTIDIHHPDEAIAKIEQILRSDPRDAHLQAIQQAKDRVIGPLNAFEVLASLCDSLDLSLPRQDVTLRPAGTDFHSVIRELFVRPYFKLRYWTRRHLGLVHI